MAHKDFLMLKDVAGYFGVSTGSVRNWIRGGKLKAILTPGGHRRIRRTDFELFLKKYQEEMGTAGNPQK
jgi:excisionase family DNA binding protein